MKGLELCKQYFLEVGMPSIQQEVPEVMPYLAAGLGGGSQCHENDDEISRDHGWGPGFGVWLPTAAKARFEQKLRAVLDRLPSQFRGCGWASEEEARHACLILDLDDFIQAKVGVADAPLHDIDWLAIAEERLFEIAHCRIFHDGLGETTRRFHAFQRYYADDVWKKRLAHHVHELWRWKVQYVQRSAKRGDYVTAGLLWGRLAEHAMKVVFLLNREYAPYDKWLYVQLRKLPFLGQELGHLIASGITKPSEIGSISEQIEASLRAELIRAGFEPQEVPHAAYPKETIRLLEFAAGIDASIRNADIREFSFR